MAETEFDELDKAVASVLGSPAPAVTPATPDAPAVSTPTPASPPPTPRQVKPAGRFMDVMHPSSDMRPTPRPAAPAAPLAATPEPVKPAEPAAPTPVQETSSFIQPDPLDFHKFSMPEEAPAPTAEASVEKPAAPAPASETPPEQPLTTPFLADAKVEKRPLGAFSDTATKPETAEEAPADAPAELNTEKAKSEEGLPAELHQDLLSIEASEPPLSPSEPEAETTDESAPPVPSIVQQYQEKPNSNTAPTAAIYDTEPYHTPLIHAEKKHNGWMIVVWVVAIILVGAAIGAALYFVVLPHA